jgi:hypothetical protein
LPGRRNGGTAFYGLQVLGRNNETVIKYAEKSLVLNKKTMLEGIVAAVEWAMKISNAESI